MKYSCSGKKPLVLAIAAAAGCASTGDNQYLEVSRSGDGCTLAERENLIRSEGGRRGMSQRTYARVQPPSRGYSGTISTVGAVGEMRNVQNSVHIDRACDRQLVEIIDDVDQRERRDPDE